MNARPIPDGYAAIVPYLIVEGASDAIAFYKEAFGATEVMRHEMDGRIVHSEIRIGGRPVMLADGCPAMGAKGPKAYGGSPISLFFYSEDVDSAIDRAVKAGAKLLRPATDHNHGDRMGGVEDPFGHGWWIATRLEQAAHQEAKSLDEPSLAGAGA